MANFDAMEAVAREHMKEPEALAFFYAACAEDQKRRNLDPMLMNIKARNERIRHIQSFVTENNFKAALDYDEKHNVLDVLVRTQLAQSWFEFEMKAGRPWEAQKIAAKYRWPGKMMESAIAESERILACKQDPTRALEIAKGERFQDADYVMRAARHAFDLWLTGSHPLNYSQLKALVMEFAPHFTEAEIALVSLLDEAKRAEDDKRYSRIRERSALPAEAIDRS